MERLSFIDKIKGKIAKTMFRVFTDHSDEVIEQIVNEELGGQGLYDRQVERAKQWLNELKDRETQPDSSSNQ